MKSGTEYRKTRKYPRYNAKHRALVLLQDKKTRSPFHIVQIGQGGLSFRYLGQKLRPSEVSRISLYHENQLIVDSIPVKPVSDFRLSNTFVSVRCSCVSFQELDNGQKQKVDDFIQNYTMAGS